MHKDGGDFESVLFENVHGPLPDGHEWLFAVNGFIHPLPNKKGGRCAIIIAPGIYHGTLPTSSTEPNIDHGNLGSAIFTKNSTVESMVREIARAKTAAPTSASAVPVYVINLKRRPERLAHTTKQLDARGITYEVVGAWDAKQRGLAATDAKLEELFPDKAWQSHAMLDMSTLRNQAMDLGRKGCTISHMLALLQAAQRGHDRVVVLEDDITVLDTFPTDFSLPEGGAAIGYLGCEVNKDGVTDAGARQYKQCPGSSWFRPDAKAFSVWCTHAYIAQDPGALASSLQCHRPKAIDAMLKSYIHGTQSQKHAQPIFVYKPSKQIEQQQAASGKKGIVVQDREQFVSDVTWVGAKSRQANGAGKKRKLQ